MFTFVLPGNTRSVLDKLSQSGVVNDFYLTGGTALALQIGHRESEDLDFFCETDFNPTQMQKKLEKLGKLESLAIEPGTLNFFFGWRQDSTTTLTLQTIG